MSNDFAGNIPLLRVTPRRAKIAAMNQGAQFDLQKIKRAIIENTGPGRPFSRRSLSMAATNNKNPDLVRDFISRGQDRKPSFEAVAGLAKALGLSVNDFVIGASLASTEPVKIKVIGAVEAGAWRQTETWDEERQFSVEVMPTPYASAGRFALEVVGYSMDKLFLPGFLLDCLAVRAGELTPQSGDIVIVERRRGDLIETTCKRLEQLPDGSYQLRAESTRPEFAEPIPIGRPDDGHFADEETRVIAIVNSAVMRVLQR